MKIVQNCIYFIISWSVTIIQAKICFTNNTHEPVWFVCLEESIMHNAEWTSYSGTQHQRLLPRRCCSNHGPVRDVLARHTLRLNYALFVTGVSAWIVEKESIGGVFLLPLLLPPLLILLLTSYVWVQGVSRRSKQFEKWLWIRKYRYFVNYQ